MKELAETGYMSNRARQNVASFFVHYLHQDWRIGADYFAGQLLDYDPSSNYLNWQYVAGVGHDPRDHRIFNVVKQGLRTARTKCGPNLSLPQFGVTTTRSSCSYSLYALLKIMVGFIFYDFKGTVYLLQKDDTH